MNWDSDAAGREAMKASCRLQCPLRHNAATDNLPDHETSACDVVEWAGFAVNLDFAFSQNHRDRVYLEHLKRMRKAQQMRPDGIQVCACEIAAHNGKLVPDAAQENAVQVDAIS